MQLYFAIAPRLLPAFQAAMPKDSGVTRRAPRASLRFRLFMSALLDGRGRPLSRRQWLLTACSLLPAARRLSAADDTKFSTDVKVVNVFVTVRDKQGKIVKNLA